MADNSEGIWWDEASEDNWLNSSEDASQVVETTSSDDEVIQRYLDESLRKAMEEFHEFLLGLRPGGVVGGGGADVLGGRQRAEGTD